MCIMCYMKPKLQCGNCLQHLLEYFSAKTINSAPCFRANSYRLKYERTSSLNNDDLYRQKWDFSGPEKSQRGRNLLRRDCGTTIKA
jgi:hypothetical protein